MRTLLFTAVCTLSLSAAALADDPAGDRVDFNRQIRPILSENCFPCHGPDANHREADLRLDIAVDASGDRPGSTAIVPGNPDASEVVRRLLADETERMPPVESGKELTADQIELLRRWIAEGAEYQVHWAFIPPVRPDVPKAADEQAREAWAANDIDRFLWQEWERAGVGPSPNADPATLARRLHFDLTGLPPTTDALDTFLADKEPGAWERLVDELLSSPHYGERMATYWLDLVRFANTVGYHGDQEHAIAPYRDWVIRAFNNNMPFDQFTTEQLAGDLLPEPTTSQLIATGYNRLLQTSHEGGVQQKEYLAKYSADRVRNFSAVWMGATLGCAECHDHKYDPYSQRDFYTLAAFFADVDDLRSFKGGDTTPTKREPEMVVLSPLVQAEIDRLRGDATDVEARIAAGTAADDAETLRARLASLQERIATLEQRQQRTMITERIEPRPIRVLDRGDWMDDTGEIVQPAVPHFLPQVDAAADRATRLELAQWLMSPDHPQTSRVFVNRLWYLFFGAGLSRSLEDNGAQGEPPTHPELLDWLAVEFRESGWDVQHMVRLIVTSRAYRQSSLVPPTLRELDPENRLFARQGRHRLPAEMIRDSALAVSGLLVDDLAGGTSHPYQPAGYYAALNFPKREYAADADERQYRRGVYVHWQRQYLHPMLRAFDAPTREECTAQRPVSNTPLSALVMLNDPTMIEAARAFAARALLDGGDSDEDRLIWTWTTALGRPAQTDELAALQRLLSASRAEYAAQPAAADALLDVGLRPVPEGLAPAELAAWTNISRAVFNVSEFITRN